MRVTAIYPGTFDPMTVGHTDVVARASRMFDEVIVAVGANSSKSPFFSPDERVAMAREIVADLDNVSVQPFDGLLVDFVSEVDGKVIVRGLRAISDFDYEVQIAGVNRHLAPDVDTVFIAASQDYTFLSSSIVREIARLHGDVSDFVHPLVLDAFNTKLARDGKQ
jgi:pantetheine-phosphate adenylyltransferase